MNNHAEREEYVQEDAGIIYVGSTNRIGMVGWNFGQVKGSQAGWGYCSYDPGSSAAGPAEKCKFPTLFARPSIRSLSHSEDVY